MIPTPFLKIGALIGATALFGAFASYRFAHAGQWLPPLPSRIGSWEGTEAPLPAMTLELLGNPQATGMDYSNPFGEVVRSSLVAAGPFENYHDPTVCVSGGGFHLSGKKTFSLDGPRSGKVRAMIFRNGEARILMYYWQQNRDGSTSPEARMGNYRDIAARFETGYGAVMSGHQTVLVRIFTFISPDDTRGVQAQHNMDQVAKAIYHSLQKSGRGADTGAGTAQ
ncbi:MAG: exosortase-associated EpsI family protein [Cytophagales bacterium]|nr:exosortase-associated EpsI family protein [Armatimonadota bacterium]